MATCKRKNRNCRYVYNQNSYQCKKCIEENLNQYPITCEDVITVVGEYAIKGVRISGE